MNIVTYVACVLTGLGALALVLNALDDHNKGGTAGTTTVFLLRIAIAASTAFCVWRAFP